MPYPLLCWWHHLAFFNVAQETPNPTRIKWFKARCYRTPNFWSFASFWFGRANLVLFNPSKTQFLQLSTQHNLPDNFPIFFNDTQLSLSSTLNTRGLSFNKNLNWQFHISTLAKSASKKLGVLWRLHPFFFSLPATCSEQGPYPPMYGVWFSCLGGFNWNSFTKQNGV